MENHESFFKIKTKKKKSKGKKALFSKETKEKILDRDKVCILCKSPGHSCHHCYFSNDANRSDQRNEIDQGCLLCFDCHLQVHSCASGEGEREECILYLQDHYKKI